MRQPMRQPMRLAFTLVELMIVVAIIAILAAIAVPNFYHMQLRAKRAELPLIVEGFASAITAADIEVEDWTEFLSLFTGDGCVSVPHFPPDKSLHPWPAEGTTDCDLWGFRPDGAVRGSYVAVFAQIRGFSDLDGDGTLQVMELLYEDTSFNLCDVGDEGCSWQPTLVPASCAPFNYGCDVY